MRTRIFALTAIFSLAIILVLGRVAAQGTKPQISLEADTYQASLRDLADPGAHVLDPQTWGSWFEYALPQLEMAVDSRIEMFRPDVWQTYESIVAGQDGWERQMAEWGVMHVVVEADATAFRDRLVRAGWEVAYEDPDGALLVRR